MSWNYVNSGDIWQVKKEVNFYVRDCIDSNDSCFLRIESKEIIIIIEKIFFFIDDHKDTNCPLKIKFVWNDKVYIRNFSSWYEFGSVFEKINVK